MGVDMWLRSVLDFENDEQVESVVSKVGPIDEMSGDRQAASEIYDRLRATGGYYREAYRGADVGMGLHGNLLPMLGLSWNSVLRALQTDGHGLWEMTPDHARHFLEELRTRPISPAMIEARVASADFVPSEQEVHEARRRLQARRAELMALLQKA